MKKDNILGFPGYYISKRGRVFSRIELKPQGNLKGSKPKGFMSGSSNSMYGSIRIGNASKYSLKEILDWYILYEKGESIKNICKLKGVPYKVVSRKIKLINSDRNKYLTYLYTTLNIF